MFVLDWCLSFACIHRVLEFNNFDLYTKDEHGLYENSVDDLWPYYQNLIDKYMPGKLKW